MPTARPGALACLFFLAGCAADPGGGSATGGQDLAAAASHDVSPGLALSVHTTLGIPEPATHSDPKHALLVKPQYVTSFDSETRSPRWTSWELTNAWLGTTPRSPFFQPDAQLPAGMSQPTGDDYLHSGFDIGHLCPSADRTDNVADNEATFVFTNAVPQTTASNTGTWETLESYTRAIAKSGKHVFITAGSLYGDDKTIGSGVPVPTSMWKIVVVLQGDHPLPTDVTPTTRVIAVDIPNTTTVTGDFKPFRVSFGSLEAKTGMTFLSDVPKDVHDALAAKVDIY